MVWNHAKVDLARCLSKTVCVDKFTVVGIEYEQERQPESSSVCF